MGIQVASLSPGTGIAVQQEHPQEKKPSLTPEQKEAEAHLPVSLKVRMPDIKQTTADLERIGLAFNRRLKFIIDQESKEVIIKVIDNETDKVIKVLPPEELQRLHSRIRETIGFLFDRMV
jgi:flagellar protein FlaG